MEKRYILYSLPRKLIGISTNKGGNLGCVGVGKDLAEQNITTSSLIKGNIGNGEVRRFWLDKWGWDCTLKECFQALFALENDKEATRT
ncbi:hypothetical protein HanRHA438_Chr15g0696771 [Helianthus annuus]|nr:hypothetical protein HanRHA438_Chr15g0696771 [Helianthus annuus]